MTLPPKKAIVAKFVVNYFKKVTDPGVLWGQAWDGSGNCPLDVPTKHQKPLESLI
jgi:hypothetical protein